MPPAAIVCGHLSQRRIVETGDRGHELALAATILGYAFTAVVLLLVVLWLGVMLSLFAVFFAAISQGSVS